MSKGYLIQGSLVDENYPLNRYRSIIYIEDGKVYYKTMDGVFQLSGENGLDGENGTIDLSNYYTKEEIDNKLLDIVIDGAIDESVLNSLLVNYVTITDLETKLEELSNDDYDINDYAKLIDLDTKVDKVDGMGLSTHNFSEDYKNRLDNINIDANENIIEAIKINGVSQEVVDKTVDLGVYIIEEIDAKLDALDIEVELDFNISDYSNTVEMNSAISTAIAQAQLDGGDVDLSGFETIVANDTKLALKADKSELDALIIPSIDGLATEAFVTDAIADIPTVDLSDFITKDEVDININTAVSNLVNGAPETFNTLKEIADWIDGDGVSVTELTTAIAGKADKVELEGLATEAFVTDAIADIPAVDLTTYETIDANDVKLALKADKTELDGLATEAFVMNTIGSIPTTDLTPYETIVDNDVKLALKADKVELEGLATEAFVTDAIADIPAVDLTTYSNTVEMNSAISTAIAQAQLDGGDVDLSGFETIVANDNKLALKADKTELDGLATEAFVMNTIGSIPTTDLTPYETIADNDVKLSLKADKTEVEDMVDTLVIPIIDGLATEAFVMETFGSIPPLDLTPYETIVNNDSKLELKADKTEVTDAVTFVMNAINDIPETDLSSVTSLNEFNEYKESVAETFENTSDNIRGLGLELANKANVSDVESELLLKADKTDLVGLATEAFVTDAIAAIPTTDLSSYETIITNDAKLDAKVDKVDGKELSSNDFSDTHLDTLTMVNGEIDFQTVPTYSSDITITEMELGKPSISNYTNGGRYTYINVSEFENKTITKLTFDVVSGGTLTIYRITNYSQSVENQKHIVVDSIILYPNVTEYEVYVELGTDENIGFGWAGDTATFRFVSSEGPNPVGGGFRAFNNTTFLWTNGNQSNLNIGIYATSTPGEKTISKKFTELEEKINRLNLNTSILNDNVLGVTKSGASTLPKQIFTCKPNLPTDSLYTNVHYFVFTNNHLLEGETVCQLEFDIVTPGTITVGTIRNHSNPSILVTRREILTFTEVGRTIVPVNIFVKPGEALFIVEKGDTAIFKHSIISSDYSDDGSGFTSIRHSADNIWAATYYSQNVGVWIVNNGTAKSNFIEYSNPLKDKIVSIVGDSISTYSGIIFPGNTTFYPSTGAAVTDITQMWWHKLIKNSGAKFGTIDAWSGSRVVSGAASSMQNRLNRLNPKTDVCIVKIGTNDLSNASPLGTLDFTSAFTLTEFTDAYCNMVQTYITNYPNTKFYFCTIMKRAGASVVFPWKQAEFIAMNNRIKEICSIYGVACIDMDGLGISHFNYATYLPDGTHPNQVGMDLISKYIFRKL